MSKFCHIRNTLGAIAITLTALSTGCAVDASDGDAERLAESSSAVESAADESAATQELMESIEAGDLSARERVLMELVQALVDGAVTGPQAELIDTMEQADMSPDQSDFGDVTETDVVLPGTPVMK